MSAGGGGGVKAEPNVTPMIDVMLVLLIIFMVVTPALLAGFNAVPPTGQNLKDHPEDAENDQVLGIDRDGNYYLNKKPISKSAIEGEIKRIYDIRTVDKVMASKNGVRVVGLIGEQKSGTVSTVVGDSKAPGAPH
jgi:biopolymer transport protein ExbD